MRTDEEVWLDDYDMRRKRFIYDRRTHYSYVFTAAQEIYTVILGHFSDAHEFAAAGYRMPDGIAFPLQGMAEVCFDIFDGVGCPTDFRHVQFYGLGSAAVLQTVALTLLAHVEKFGIGGFVFQAASGAVAEAGRKISLEDTYEYILGLKNELRYNPRTRLPKKQPRKLLPNPLRAYKVVNEGRACYAVLQ